MYDAHTNAWSVPYDGSFDLAKARTSPENEVSKKDANQALAEAVSAAGAAVGSQGLDIHFRRPFACSHDIDRIGRFIGAYAKEMFWFIVL